MIVGPLVCYQVKSAVSVHKAEVGGDVRKRSSLGQVESLGKISGFQNAFEKCKTFFKKKKARS